MRQRTQGETVGIGVIGAGAFAKAGQIPAFRLCPDAAVVSIYGHHVEKTEAIAREFGIPHVCTDYHEMLKMDDVDLVSIVTPPSLHYPLVLEALEAGKHILCEKPMALSSREAIAMWRRAEEREVVHCIDHQLRFNPTRRKMKELIDHGYLGRLRHITITVSAAFNATADSRPWNWWSQKSMGGGILGANGSHYIDLLRWWFGEIRAVSGQLCTSQSMRKLANLDELQTVETDDLCVFLCEFEKGGQGTVILSTVDHHAQGHRLEAFGDRGTLALDGQGRLWGGKLGEERLTDLTAPDPATELEGITRNVFPMSFVHFACALVASVKSGIPPTDAANFYDGMRCQQVMDAVSRSWHEKRWVELSEIQNME
jgi:predicted dehydrogenase